MRLSPVAALEPGTTLARDVSATTTGPPLLRAGVRLGERYLAALRAAGVRAVWIEDALGEGLAPATLLQEETRRHASEAVGRALASLAQGHAVSDEGVAELTAAAGAIVDEVLAAPESAVHLADMMGADQYLLQHVVDVTALGVLVARRRFRQEGWVDARGRRRIDDWEARLGKLGLGLLLHDLGKLRVPRAVLDKPGALDAAEWAEIRRHPELGVAMLGDDVSFLVKGVVRQHHERWDGGGYPDGLAGEQIHQFARVAAVADVFDAVTSERVYRHAAPPWVGWGIVAGDRGAAFDPVVVGDFCRVVVPFPVGYEIALADGRTGVVSAVDPGDPLRPTVRVAGPGGAIDEVAHAEPAAAAELPATELAPAA